MDGVVMPKRSRKILYDDGGGGGYFGSNEAKEEREIRLMANVDSQLPPNSKSTQARIHIFHRLSYSIALSIVYSGVVVELDLDGYLVLALPWKGQTFIDIGGDLSFHVRPPIELL
ncbi:hypothetical protein Tco_0059122 [Tanacetum coccineum]